MKSFYYAVCAVSLFALVSCGQKNSIDATIAGVESDTVYVSYFKLGERTPGKTDTVALSNNKMVYNMPDSGSYNVRIIPAPKFVAGNVKPAVSMQAVTFYYFAGDKLKVVAEFTPEDVVQTITGSDVYTDMNAFEASIKSTSDDFKAKYQKYIELYQQKAPEAEINAMRDSLISLQNQMNDAKKAFIYEHPASQVSGLYLANVPIDSVAAIANILAPEVRNGKFKNVIDQTMASYERNEKLKIAREKVAPGQPAPDFTLNDLQGKPFTLSSLYGKGKYIVLDFWGSWCGWCIKGIPDMKKYYEKYGKKLEIVGIDCGDTEEKWKAAVEEYKLPWIGVYNTKEADIPTMYAVTGYPTKVIIAPDGKIVKTVVGESPVFYETIDELMKK